MKKRWMIAAVVLCLTSLAVAAQATPAEQSAMSKQALFPEMCPVAEHALAAPSTPLGSAPWLGTVQPFGLPSCSSVHGTSCSPPGSHRFCLLAPGEPEICVCQNNNTWKCYWW